MVCKIYQTTHFSFGFIFDPTGHLKAAAKSLEFINGTFARNWLGE